MKINTKDLENIFIWIKGNFDDLMEMWKMYESGSEDPTDIILSLKSVEQCIEKLG